MSEAEMCGPCFDGQHSACTGLRCTCTETSRCLLNAILTEERRLDDETGAA